MKAATLMAAILYIAALGALFMGWIFNMLYVARVVLDGGYMSDSEFIVRIIGLFIAPVGGFLGWM